MQKTVNEARNEGGSVTEALPDDAEPYIRSTDGARMIVISPGSFVNEAVWKTLGALR